MRNTNFNRKTKSRDHLEDLDVEGRIMLEWILKSKVEGNGLNRIQRLAVVNKVMNFRVL
jgi:hypothetical protein